MTLKFSQKGYPFFNIATRLSAWPWPYIINNFRVNRCSLCHPRLIIVSCQSVDIPSNELARQIIILQVYCLHHTMKTIVNERPGEPKIWHRSWKAHLQPDYWEMDFIESSEALHACNRAFFWSGNSIWQNFDCLNLLCSSSHEICLRTQLFRCLNNRRGTWDRASKIKYRNPKPFWNKSRRELSFSK